MSKRPTKKEREEARAVELAQVEAAEKEYRESLRNFNRKQMPPEARPTEGIGLDQTYSTIEFQTQRVEFENQNPEILCLRLKGQRFEWSQKLIDELTEALGQGLASEALQTLDRLKTVRFVLDAIQ